MCSHCNCKKDFSVPGSKIESGETITVESKCDCEEKENELGWNQSLYQFAKLDIKSL